MSSLLSHIGHDFFLDLSSEHTCVVDAVYRECTRMSQETSVIDRHRSSLLHQLDIGCFLDLLMTHPHRHHSDGMISWSGDRGKRLVLHVLLVSRSAECTCTISRISSGVYRMNFSVYPTCGDDVATNGIDEALSLKLGKRSMLRFNDTLSQYLKPRYLFTSAPKEKSSISLGCCRAARSWKVLRISSSLPSERTKGVASTDIRRGLASDGADFRAE